MRLSMHKRRPRRPRAKNPLPLAGLPRPVIALAPQGWPPAKAAAWCRAFLVGAGDPPGARPETSAGRRVFEVRAFRAGAAAVAADPELAGVLRSFFGAVAARRLA